MNTTLTSRQPTSLSALSIPLSLPVYIQPRMLIILLVLSGCQIPICYLFRLFALYLAPAASVLQLAAPKIWNSSLQLFECAPTPTLFVFTLRHTISSRSSNPFNAFLLVRQIRLLVTVVRIYKLYLLTYLFSST